MKIIRLPKEASRGSCDDCHNTAELEVNYGQKRPALRLCMRCGRYLSGVMINRIAEAEAGVPIPEPGTRPYRTGPARSQED